MKAKQRKEGGILTIKRLLVGMICISSMLLPMHSYAAEQSGTTTLTTTVPDKHVVELRIGEHGALEINGRVYRGVMRLEADRGTTMTYKVIVDEGWDIASLSYGIGDKQVDIDLDTLTFTAPALTEDGIVLHITFKEASAGGETTDKDDHEIKDTSMLIQTTGLCTMILLSGVLLLLVERRKRI